VEVPRWVLPAARAREGGGEWEAGGGPWKNGALGCQPGGGEGGDGWRGDARDHVLWACHRAQSWREAAGSRDADGRWSRSASNPGSEGLNKGKKEKQGWNAIPFRVFPFLGV
jgi:hypothetical protein